MFLMVMRMILDMVDLLLLLVLIMWARLLLLFVLHLILYVPLLVLAILLFSWRKVMLQARKKRVKGELVPCQRLVMAASIPRVRFRTSMSSCHSSCCADALVDLRASSCVSLSLADSRALKIPKSKIWAQYARTVNIYPLNVLFVPAQVSFSKFRLYRDASGVNFTSATFRTGVKAAGGSFFKFDSQNCPPFFFIASFIFVFDPVAEAAVARQHKGSGSQVGDDRDPRPLARVERPGCDSDLAAPPLQTAYLAAPPLERSSRATLLQISVWSELASSALLSSFFPVSLSLDFPPPYPRINLSGAIFHVFYSPPCI